MSLVWEENTRLIIKEKHQHCNYKKANNQRNIAFIKLFNKNYSYLFPLNPKLKLPNDVYLGNP